MATLRNKRKLAAVSRETPESTRSGRTQNILDPELTQDYISQVSEEIEGRVTKKLSKEFSRTESRILGALSKLDEFLLNPQVRACSVAVPGTSRSSNLENQGTNEDRPSDDPGPEVEFSSPHYGAETDPHMVTGVTSEIRQHPHMTMETQEEIPYCSTSTSSGKQKKARSTSQTQFRSENTPATLEADQILLALQQLATNSNPANLNNNISRISKLPKSLTTTMPTFDGKSEKFELFEDLFQTSLKRHNHLTEEDKINYFHSLMRGDALQTFKNITSPNRENLAEILTVFRRKYVKPQQIAKTTMVVPQQTLTPTTKHQSQTRLTIQIIKETEDLDLSFHPVRHVAEPTTPQRDATLEQTRRKDRLLEIDGRKDKTKPNREILKINRMAMPKLQLNL